MIDPTIEWGDEKDIMVWFFPWQWLPVQLVTLIVFLIARGVVTLVGLFACLPAAWIYARKIYWIPNNKSEFNDSWPRWAWLWGDTENEPEGWWWVPDGGSNKAGGHWSTRWRWFGVYWWHAWRNPAGNFTRTWPAHGELSDIRRTAGSHIGSLNPAFAYKFHGKVFTYRVKWDSRRPWLAWFEFKRRWTETHYGEFKIGFRVGQTVIDGLGYTIRPLGWWRKYGTGK